jgi:hypothetical protein
MPSDEAALRRSGDRPGVVADVGLRPSIGGITGLLGSVGLVGDFTIDVSAGRHAWFRAGPSVGWGRVALPEGSVDLLRSGGLVHGCGGSAPRRFRVGGCVGAMVGGTRAAGRGLVRNATDWTPAARLDAGLELHARVSRGATVIVYGGPSLTLTQLRLVVPTDRAQLRVRLRRAGVLFAVGVRFSVWSKDPRPSRR